MNTAPQEKISVVTVFDVLQGTIMPRKIKWNQREYTMTKLGYYHKYRVGRSIMHIFHVTDGHLDFRLRMDAENLHWVLEEVTDGQPD